MRWVRFDEWEFGSPGGEAVEVVTSTPDQHHDFPNFVAGTLLAGRPARAVPVSARPPRDMDELLLVEWAMKVVETHAGVELLGEPSLCGLFVAAVTPDRREVAVDAGNQFAAVRWERRSPAEQVAAPDRGHVT